MPTATFAATQFACSLDLPANLDAAERVVRAAARVRRMRRVSGIAVHAWLRGGRAQEAG